MLSEEKTSSIQSDISINDFGASKFFNPVIPRFLWCEGGSPYLIG